MSYFLQPLLRIRVMREDRAAGELTVARRAVAEAERKLEERKSELGEARAHIRCDNWAAREP